MSAAIGDAKRTQPGQLGAIEMPTCAFEQRFTENVFESFLPRWVCLTGLELLSFTLPPRAPALECL